MFDNLSESIVQEALKWLDTPWRHQGRTKRGIDCAGLIIRVGNDLGLIDYDVSHYPRDTRRDTFINHFKMNMIQKSILEKQAGDVLLFRAGIYACHCGILHFQKTQPYLIHAYVNYKKVVNEHLTKELCSRVTHCFRFPGVA